MLLHDRMRHAYDPSHVLHDPLRQSRARACALVTRTPDDPNERFLVSVPPLCRRAVHCKLRRLDL